MSLLGGILRRDRQAFNFPRDLVSESVLLSPDGRHMAWLADHQGRMAVGVDGRTKSRHDSVSGLDIATDENSAAYMAVDGSRARVFFRSLVCGPYFDVGVTSPVVSPDSQHVAYTALTPRGWATFVDGDLVGGTYEGLAPGGIVFSPDSRHIGYVVRDGDKWSACVDGDVVGTHPSILARSWCFTPDSRHLAYVAVCSGHKGSAGWIGEACVVIGTRHLRRWEHDEAKGDGLSSEVVFSPDARRCAYIATSGGKVQVVADDQPGEGFGSLVSGWGAVPDWKKLVCRGRASVRESCVTFSPDSRHLAYAMADLQRHRHVVVYDGAEAANHEGVVNTPIVFSPDSQRVAYGAADGGAQFLVLDWTPLEGHYGLPTILPSFSPDSEHVAYVATTDAQSFRLVVDARSWSMQGMPPMGAAIWWEGATTARIWSAAGRRVQLGRYALDEPA